MFPCQTTALWQNKGCYDKGYAESVPTEKLDCCTGRVWYISHHGVHHPKKRTLRVVFDCGATFMGTSLNEQLLQGPNLTSTLVGVLLRFRQEAVAVMGDIQSMFHQVKVPEEDRDFLRFLWWPEGDLTKEVSEFRMTVHLFGAVSSPSCASFALRKTADDIQSSSPSYGGNLLGFDLFCTLGFSITDDTGATILTVSTLCQQR